MRNCMVKCRKAIDGYLNDVHSTKRGINISSYGVEIGEVKSMSLHE